MGNSDFIVPIQWQHEKQKNCSPWLNVEYKLLLDNIISIGVWWYGGMVVAWVVAPIVCVCVCGGGGGGGGGRQLSMLGPLYDKWGPHIFLCVCVGGGGGGGGGVYGSYYHALAATLWIRCCHPRFEEIGVDFGWVPRCVTMYYIVATPEPRYCPVWTRLRSGTGKFSCVVLRYVSLPPRRSLAVATLSYAVPRIWRSIPCHNEPET